MSNYKVAIVGRPNVGKSALTNRLCERDEAIVHEKRGVTRDRSYHDTSWRGCDLTIIDTGGIDLSNEDVFASSIKEQALQGAREADVVVFLVDGNVGIQNNDMDVANILKKCKRPVILAVNKMDTPNDDANIWEFTQLGFGEPMPVSAVHGHGTGDLLDRIVDLLQDVEPNNVNADDEEDVINVAIIGRPNAGKSTLTNRLVKAERSIVSDVAGTTRDAVDTLIEHGGKKYRIIDTAGLRKKSKIDESVEYYGYVRAMRAIDRADVAILVVDGTVGITNEDQRVTNYAKDRGCAFIIALNKWDAVEGAEEKAEVRANLEEFMQFASFAPVQSISALTGKKVDRIWDSIDLAYENFTKRLSTSKMNEWLSTIKEGGHTVSKGKATLRMKYITQAGIMPPTFVIFCNRPDLATDNFKRFIENKLRQTFSLSGTPVRIFFKSKD